MTREEFTSLFNLKNYYCAPSNAMKCVSADFEFQGADVWLNFDGYVESEVLDFSYDFFAKLKEKLEELDNLSKEKISELELNYNDVELKLSEVRFRKPYEDNEGFYHCFSMAYEGGEDDDDDEEFEGLSPNILMIHICFNKEFNFVEGFVESEMVD